MYLILAKFRYDWVKIVDFLIKGHFWSSPHWADQVCSFSCKIKSADASNLGFLAIFGRFLFNEIPLLKISRRSHSILACVVEQSEDASDEMFISHQFIQTLNTDETRIFCHLAEGRPADKGCQVCVRLRAF